jgi:hypothetical protein
VKKSAWLSLPAMLGLFVSLAVPQSTHHFPTPPESLDAQPPKVYSPTAPLRVDIEQLQREADTLARTAQTIPSDVASIRKGMLPKDAIEKLKQIEKLSKHLRTELTP